MSYRHKTLILGLAVALALGFVSDAGARAGSGFSFGNRGARSFSAAPTTPTAPRGAAPLDRSTVAPNSSAFQQRAPAFTQSRFASGLLGGFLGAGLFGLLFGHGLFGGLTGGFSLLGLLVQLGLLFLLFKLIMSFWRGLAIAPQGTAGTFGVSRGSPASGPFPGFGFGGSATPAAKKLALTSADFNTFEQRLSEIQNAFSAGDYNRLRPVTTPEMASCLMGELAENTRKGVINKISNVQFLQGDLAESWRERQDEYATVAMRFSLIDTLEDCATGRIVSGDPARPQEATEVWTFVRGAGGEPREWKLSAIQQAA